MNEINQILTPVKLPRIVKVKQKFLRPQIENIQKEISDQMITSRVHQKIKSGSKIAITGGSRGIADYQTVMRCVVDFVKLHGGEPFIVPAMGSHGGGNAKGQTKMLEKLGISEDTVGAPILSSMEVVEIGISESGLPVYVDKNAYEADGIILLNRIKIHTSFRGKYESGLVKMLAIGLGKRKGADVTHSLRFEKMADNIVSMAKVSLEKLNIICAVGTIENGYDEIAQIYVLKKDEILDREPTLLEISKNLMSKIYLDEIDVLIVSELGKNISGTGMDTNIIGRYHTNAIDGGPDVTVLGLLDVTEKSDGNANGMGLADFISRKLYNKLNLEATYINAITSTAPGSVKTPAVLDNDEYVIKACVKICGNSDTSKIKLIIIQNTKHLDTIYMTQSAIDAVKDKDREYIEVVGEFQEIEFDENRNLEM